MVPLKAMEAERKARQAAEAQAARAAELSTVADDLRKQIAERDAREAARSEAVTKRAQERIAALPETLRALAPRHLTGDDLADWVDTAAAQAAVLSRQAPATVTPGRSQGEGGAEEPTPEMIEWGAKQGFKDASPPVLMKAYRKFHPAGKTA